MKATMTSREAREKLDAHYRENKSLIAKTKQYGETARALGVEHHLAYIEEIFGETGEETLVLEIDARLTPVSFAKELSQILDKNGKPLVGHHRVVYDPARYKFYFFGKTEEIKALTPEDLQA